MDEKITRQPAIRRTAAPLRNQVVDELRRGIVTGVYAPGSRLVERPLCEQLGVSRTVIRESLRQLESEQLVAVIPNYGPVVRSVTLAEARNLYEVRGALESLAARACAERASDHTIAELKKALEQIPSAGAINLQERLEAQDRFIAIMVESADNPVLTQMLAQIRSRVNLLRARTLLTGGAHRQAPGLTRIFHAIEVGDPEAAEVASRDYVRVASQDALAHFAEPVSVVD